MKFRFIFLVIIVTISMNLMGQGTMSWFEASSTSDADYEPKVSADCQLKDQKSDSKLNEIEFLPKEFFVYTNPQVKKYLANINLMECMAYVNKVEENVFLILEYRINSAQAKNNYGNLDKGGKVKIHLTNKDHVYLENIERSRGKVRRNDKYTVYTGTYAINKDNQNLLRKHSVDKITVLWEEGVEQYEIQNIDLVKNQLNYLEDL